jgi:hypothetical protein
VLAVISHDLLGPACCQACCDCEACIAWHLRNRYTIQSSLEYDQVCCMKMTPGRFADIESVNPDKVFYYVSSGSVNCSAAEPLYDAHLYATTYIVHVCVGKQDYARASLATGWHTSST